MKTFLFIVIYCFRCFFVEMEDLGFKMLQPEDFILVYLNIENQLEKSLWPVKISVNPEQ